MLLNLVGAGISSGIVLYLIVDGKMKEKFKK